jgi:hypothetical protein
LLNHKPLVSVILLAVMLLLVACDDGEEGSGRLSTESRAVGEFTAVDVSQALHSEITIGTPLAVEVEFDDNLLENLQIEVRGDTLHISCDPDCDPSSGAVVRITMPEIVAIGASGASRVEVGVVNGKRLELDASGASRIEVRGSVDELLVGASGASHIKAEDLLTNLLDIKLSGASDAEVRCATKCAASSPGPRISRSLVTPTRSLMLIRAALRPSAAGS